MKDYLKSMQLHLEALVFASDSGVSMAEIIEVFSNDLNHDQDQQTLEVNENLINEILLAIFNKYDHEDSILELKKINNAYQFLTKSSYYETINKLQSHRSRKKLSQAAMETLAIIAYRQPITKLEIEHIRGVNCDYSIQRLLEKDLISIVGKAETVGKPLLYGTSSFLMDYFGLNDISELPQLKDIEPQENSIGETVE